ncbi:Uncharacterised protein [Pragia fontium]|uniref:Uncharacterized protein n=1 Tax=Pragia fontium DSM 5563 = ATCC 49100 TaxID=1122977 RepID=A0AAJ4W988_9GAMM|nr:hypothetical protein SAMN02745723_102374 [Pragia fontium DSM 5563 = ATCC 49100]SUB82226.1 Uncharacterised protein [Pragia fontium]VEJ54984.1 Uncharacterised protein [Pragia fontium]
MPELLFGLKTRLGYLFGGRGSVMKGKIIVVKKHWSVLFLFIIENKFVGIFLVQRCAVSFIV